MRADGQPQKPLLVCVPKHHAGHLVHARRGAREDNASALLHGELQQPGVLLPRAWPAAWRRRDGRDAEKATAAGAQLLDVLCRALDIFVRLLRGRRRRSGACHSRALHLVGYVCRPRHHLRAKQGKALVAAGRAVVDALDDERFERLHRALAALHVAVDLRGVRRGIACVRAGYVRSRGGRAAQPACKCCAPAPPWRLVLRARAARACVPRLHIERGLRAPRRAARVARQRVHHIAHQPLRRQERLDLREAGPATQLRDQAGKECVQRRRVHLAEVRQRLLGLPLRRAGGALLPQPQSARHFFQSRVQRCILGVLRRRCPLARRHCCARQQPGARCRAPSAGRCRAAALACHV